MSIQKPTHPTLKRKRSITERDFDLSEYRGGNGAVETDWAKRYWTFLCCPTETCTTHRHERDAHNDAIIIAVDGACRGNGRPWARSGAGVFFHRDNWRWNKAVVLEDEYNTSQRAELFACSLALRLAATLRRGNPVGRHKLRVCAGPSRRLRRVVIKADSEYLVKSMTDWVEKWRDNGYENCRGLPVTNADMFRHIDAAIFELNRLGVEVQFWHVRREENREADCLANAALDGKDPLDEFFGDSIYA
jgi:ribonuclease HI